LRPLAVRSLTIYPLALTMKRKVSHAASQRAVSEPIVVAVELANGVIGYGETLPRSYVTGETNESVLNLLRGEFVRELLAYRWSGFFEALELIDALPTIAQDGQSCPAARAAVELALLDACLKTWNRSLMDVAGWSGLPGIGYPGSYRRARYSMVLASDSTAKLRRQIRLAYLLGMRHFKLKVGLPDDDERAAIVRRFLARPLASGRATLRLDANGAWTLERAVASLRQWHDVALVGVEQPLAKDADEELRALRSETGVRIIHDESLVTVNDAQRLYALGVADGFNIRLSKCGGLLACLRMASFARKRGIDIQLGCMVGETSILSAAGVCFLRLVPGVRFCEGAFGGLLMAEDVVRRGVRFRLGGRPPRLPVAAWSAGVDPELLERHCIDRPIVIHL
jgi:muconate cycloisomerase